MALGHRQSSGKHLPAAPALSHGFGGEGVAMVFDISGVASRYEVRYIRIDWSRVLKGERREKREAKGRMWPGVEMPRSGFAEEYGVSLLSVQTRT